MEQYYYLDENGKMMSSLLREDSQELHLSGNIQVWRKGLSLWGYLSMIAKLISGKEYFQNINVLFIPFLIIEKRCYVSGLSNAIDYTLGSGTYIYNHKGNALNIY